MCVCHQHVKQYILDHMQIPSIFTKIVRGEIPSHKIYEDEHTYAFLDIHPTTESHTLVIPKKQVESVWDLDDTEYDALMTTVKKIALHLREVTEVAYVGVKIIGTDVPHAHVHLIPFDTAAQFNHSSPTDTEPNHDALAALAERLRLD